MKRWIAVIVALISVSGAVRAAEEGTPAAKVQLPVYYPDFFENRGLVLAVGRLGGEPAITVDGTRFELLAGAPIHFLSQRYGPITALKPGMGVGFRLVDTQSGRKIAEIWELPPELTPEPS